MSRVLFKQKHDSVFGKTGIGVTLNVLKSSHRLFDKKYVPNIAFHKIPHFDKSDLAVGGPVIDISLMYVSMRNHNLIHMFVCEEF